MGKKQLLQLPPAARSAEEWAVSEVLRVADHLDGLLNDALKPFGISFTQYTALKSIRDEGGLPSTAIGDHMFTRDSDVTRLVDRLVKRGLVERSRDKADRRVVRVALTPEGTDLMERLDGPVLGTIAKSFAGVKAKRVRRLTEILRQVRGLEY